MEIPVTYMTMILTIMIARIFFIRFNGDFDILSYETFSLAVYTDIKSDTLLLLQSMLLLLLLILIIIFII